MQTVSPPRLLRTIEDEEPSGGGTRQQSQKAADADVLDESHEDWGTLKFRKYEEHLTWNPTIIVAIDGDPNVIAQNAAAMEANAVRINESHSYLQHLEMARQIEIYSSKVNKNTYDAIYDLQPVLGVSIQYLRLILRVSWAVYRYPVLEQLHIRWEVGKRRVPEIASFLDRIVDRNGQFPHSIIAAQKDRHSLYFRLSLQYPERSIGDGDGLPLTTVLRVHDLYRDETPIEDEGLRSTSWYEQFRNIQGSEKRCRMVGYDTQEAPRPQNERDAETPQPFWNEGRNVLEDALGNLLHGIPAERSAILVDCYGCDCFGRLLVDVRGMYHRDELAGDSPQPSLSRFQLACRALTSGFAFPTYNFLVNERLLTAFRQAKEEQRGAFGEHSQVYHPAVCRRERYEMEKAKTRSRRRRYVE